MNAVTDTFVLAKRSLLRIRRQPDLLVGFTVQPVMFVLLFVYVFGGAIATPGLVRRLPDPGDHRPVDGVRRLRDALGLADDLKKGLMDLLPVAADVALGGADRTVSPTSSRTSCNSS